MRRPLIVLFLLPHHLSAERSRRLRSGLTKAARLRAGRDGHRGAGAWRRLSLTPRHARKEPHPMSGGSADGPAAECFAEDCREARVPPTGKGDVLLCLPHVDAAGKGNPRATRAPGQLVHADGRDAIEVTVLEAPTHGVLDASDTVSHVERNRRATSVHDSMRAQLARNRKSRLRLPRRDARDAAMRRCPLTRRGRSRDRRRYRSDLRAQRVRNRTSAPR
jgi:hypothetical protein